MTESAPIPVEHQNVPQAHQGLHQFLYSSDQEHEVINPLVQANQIDTGDRFVELVSWQTVFTESLRQTKAKIAAVYAIANIQEQTQTVQFIGIARDLDTEIELLKDRHIQENAQIRWQIKVQTFKFPKREQMTELCDRWLSELPYIPIGNQAGKQSAWNLNKSAKAMTLVERQAYEAKKLKLQTAMAIATEVTAPEDWSGLIANQTEETIESK